jgi:hypothetical protein
MITSPTTSFGRKRIALLSASVRAGASSSDDDEQQQETYEGRDQTGERRPEADAADRVVDTHVFADAVDARRRKDAPHDLGDDLHGDQAEDQDDDGARQARQERADVVQRLVEDARREHKDH